MQNRILVSACLMGQAVRYDGRAKPLLHPAIDRWRAEGRLVTICPEMSAGMPVPRPPAEIADAATGDAVLAGTARVVEITGGDVTDEFLQAAKNAVALARETGCRYALLIDGSPSCGSAFIYDGSFSGRRLAGNGVTAAALQAAGIEVFSDHEIERLIELASNDQPNGTAAGKPDGR
ncbi:DUF523 domain-containing protein [Rhizobium etli]|uniref:Uncharacterized protein YbbK (DUF523 family) n=1 Tax=Rhizobium etli TaxID=29449 RepID=A0A7W7EDN2_RHIET|nr:DUF523 domain-containing protein [Rhizobium etli]MBB4478845.1 uncharacterized protein YbbK (DUF523 family) [Rhizobium etli]MBB4534961.1 uncharacterized protein YbbK (DUF523 family) [Rhizobium etli]